MEFRNLKFQLRLSTNEVCYNEVRKVQAQQIFMKLCETL